MSTRVLFRVAAGPRIGFGHLVRSRTLAAALQMPAVVSLRGTPATARVAAGLGVRLCGSLAASLRKLRPALLVVDDPCRKAAQRAIRTARQLGIATASVHDLGLWQRIWRLCAKGDHHDGKQRHAQQHNP